MKQRTLEIALADHPLVLLRAIAAAHGIDGATLPSDELVPRLLARLLEPESLERLLAELDEGSRAALDFLIAEGGQLPSHRLQRDPLGGELRQLGPGAMERERPWAQPRSAIERLYYLGLIFQDFGAIGAFRGQVLYIPTDLLALLPPVASSPVTFVLTPLDGLPPGVREGKLALVEDAFVVLSDLQHRAVHAERGRYLPPDALQRINARLQVRELPEALGQERDTQRLALLMHLLRTLNLVDENSEGLLRPVTSRARRWLQLPRARRLLTLQRAWADDPTWNDLWRIPSLRPERTGWHNDPQRARAALQRWLRLAESGRWYAIADFVRAIKRVDPDFQRPDGDYNSWLIRHAESGQPLTGWENWDQVEGTLLRYYFAAPLRWLGVVDLGYLAPSDTQPFAFRLTPYGGRWLGKEVTLPAEPERAPVVIAVDGTIRVPRGADDWERLHLERLSLPVEGVEGEYRLDREKVIALLMEGSDVERVARFLRQATNGLLPGPVEARLREWASSYGKITIGPMTVLEVEEPGLLRDIQRQPHISQHLGRPLGPRAVLVQPGELALLVEALRKAGYLPLVRGGPAPEES